MFANSPDLQVPIRTRRQRSHSLSQDRSVPASCSRWRGWYGVPDREAWWGSAGEQLPPELGHPTPHRTIVDPLPDPHDGPAEDLGIDVEGGQDFLAELAAQGRLDIALERRVRRMGQRHARPHPIVLDVEQG